MIAFLGLTWIVGYIAERPEPFYLEAYFYEYAFFGCHTIVALTVFISYCSLRKEAATAWCQACCKCCVTNSRRRVAGKNTLGATKVKSDGSDYHLVADQKHVTRPQQHEDDVIDHDVIGGGRACSSISMYHAGYITSISSRGAAIVGNGEHQNSTVARGLHNAAPVPCYTNRLPRFAYSSFLEATTHGC